MSVCAYITAVLLAGIDPSGQIAFVSGLEQEDRCVCLLDLDSNAVTRVGTGFADGPPVWSPDGEWLAFESRRQDGAVGISIVRPDGSDMRPLNHALPINRSPRWSPDGKRLVYTATQDGAAFAPRAVVYDLETNVETPWGQENVNVMRPVWMPNLKLLEARRADEEVLWGKGQDHVTGIDWLKPDATLVAIGIIKSEKSITTDIFVVTDSHAASLPEDKMPSPGRYAEWCVEPSPDGSALAFESNDGGDREIYVLSRLGPLNVSNHRAADWNPVWSPDGQWLAFESFRDGRLGIYRVFTKTGRVIPVAVTPQADNAAPTWSPDNAFIAFASNRTGDDEIFVASIADETIRQVVSNPGIDTAPAWRPRKKP